MAGKFINKLLDYIGIEEAEFDDDELQDDFYEQSAEEQGKVLSINSKSKKNPSANNVVNLPTAAQMKVIVYHPVSYEDTQNIIDNLKSRKPVIVNMEELEIECAQRILDFMAGAVYALNGTIYKISRGIFVVAPNNYDIIGGGDSSYNDGMI